MELPLAVQRLIALLAVHNRPLQRAFVAGTLWIDSSQDRANASLRTALWRLRRLEPVVVDSSRTHVRLVREVDVDLHESIAGARDVLQHRGAFVLDDVETTLLGGDLLPDWYDDWVLIERERFRQLRLHALETLCEDLAAAGAHAAAVDAGLACVAADPLRESAHRALIKVHVAEGNVCEAIRHYGLYRKLVPDALQLVASAEMRQVIDSLPSFASAGS